MVATLEATIDELVSERPLRPVFVVPGSSAVEAAVDLARASARRAERHVIAAREAGRVIGDDVTHYLDPLHDLL
jgi:cob(I)alamin adenosyltransferase